MSEQSQNKEQIFYNKRVWLNTGQSASTGSVVCFDGILDSWEGTYRSIFVEIGDCRGKVRLHNSYSETKEQFINKIKGLQKELTDFINHLENDNCD